MIGRHSSQHRHRSSGFSMVELMVVALVIGLLSAAAVPQMLNSRRYLRMAGLSREIASGLNNARQMAMAQRRAITFQYDNTAKKINIINHGVDASGNGNWGTSVVGDASYPNTTGSSVVSSVPLAGGGITASEITHGIDSSVGNSSTLTLDDTTKMTALSSGKVNITFQPDGSVINSSGVATDFALFFYHGAKPKETAMAISVLGGVGRVKSWRYSTSASKFVE